jgi:thymidylate synthase
MKTYSPKESSTLVRWILANGQKVDSERGMTTEVLNASLVLRNPLNRLDTTRSRKLNLAFCFAEWLALMTGEDDLSFFTQFIRGYGAYSSDGKKLDGAYGPRIMMPITVAAEMLEAKPGTRRAVVSIYRNADLYGGGGLNTPCTLTYQFLAREGRLHMVCNMRSNDVYFGLGNDVVVNTMVQEWVALASGHKLGEYYHNAASLHVYHETMRKALGREEGRWPHVMPAMDPSMSDFSEVQELKKIYEHANDFGRISSYAIANLHSDYALDIANVGLSFIHRAGDGGLIAYRQINDPTLRRLALPWLKETK